MKYKTIGKKAVAPIVSTYLYDDKLNIAGVVSNREMIVIHGIVIKDNIEYFVFSKENRTYLIEKSKTIYN